MQSIVYRYNAMELGYTGPGGGGGGGGGGGEMIWVYPPSPPPLLAPHRADAYDHDAFFVKCLYISIFCYQAAGSRGGPGCLGIWVRDN